MDSMSKTGQYVSGRFYSSSKYEAKRRNIYFADDITLDYLDQLLEEQSFKCFYSGLEIDAKTRGAVTASLDRRDSNLPYTRDNIQFVHKNVNFMKWTLPESLFLSTIINIYDNMKTSKFNQEFNKYLDIK